MKKLSFQQMQQVSAGDYSTTSWGTYLVTTSVCLVMYVFVEAGSQDQINTEKLFLSGLVGVILAPVFKSI